MNKRYGVIIEGNKRYSISFTRESAEKSLTSAKKVYADAYIVEYNLVNDEGCSPYLVPINPTKEGEIV